MWFELKGDERLGQCATWDYGGQPTSRLEIDGVGSNYCSGCRAHIEMEREREEQKQETAITGCVN